MFKFSASGLFFMFLSAGAIFGVPAGAAKTNGPRGCVLPECLDYVSGAFAGIGVGCQSSTLRARPQGSNPFFLGIWDPQKNAQYAQIENVSTSRSSMQGIVGDLNFGWDARFKSSKIVLGFVLGVQGRGGKGQLSYPVVSIYPSDVDPNTSAVGVVTRGINVSSPWGGYGAFRFGVVIGRALLHAKVGLSYNYLTGTARAPDRDKGAVPLAGAQQTVVMKSHSWAPSFLGGVGVDFRVTRSVVFFSNFDINIGSKTELKFKNPKAANQQIEIPIQDPSGKINTYTYTADPALTKVSTRPVLFTITFGLRYFLPNV